MSDGDDVITGTSGKDVIVAVPGTMSSLAATLTDLFPLGDPLAVTRPGPRPGSSLGSSRDLDTLCIVSSAGASRRKCASNVPRETFLTFRGDAA